MPLYTGSKRPPGAMHPRNAIASEFSRLEPLLSPTILKSLYLKGIQLTLKVKDPETGLPFKFTDEELQMLIEQAVEEAEIETGLNIMPVQYSEKLPYQKQDWESFGYFQLQRRPISSIDSLTVRLADNSDIFTFPNEWIETSNLIWGQVNLIPLAFQGVEGGTGIIGGITSGSGTAVFFNSLWNRPWVAALFGVEYTTGFPDGLIPKSVNNLIGTIAAMNVLSQIAAASSGQTSVSLGIDGMSQSVGMPGPERYRTRMEELGQRRKLIVKKLRKMFGTSFVAGTV